MNSKIIIAKRILKNNNKELEIIIYKPIQTNEGDWFCEVKIGKCKKNVYGIDSLQAVILSFEAIRKILLTNYPNAVWHNDNNLGVPFCLPTFLPKKIIQEIENYVNEKIEIYSEKLRVNREIEESKFKFE